MKTAEATTPLKSVLVGCGRMGQNQARILASLEELNLLAICDANEIQARQMAEKHAAHTYTKFEECLLAEQPDVIVICTPNASHAALTIAAAEFGITGIYCEKPMATNLGDARAMVDTCRRQGTVLVINHQRRIGPDLVAARQLIEEGAIGELRLLRASCAGDLLSDGTHSVDSLLWLAGDPEASWVLGQIHRELTDDILERARKRSKETGVTVEPGFRYGHAVENGSACIVELGHGASSGQKVRMEILCGDLRSPGTAYQDYEIVGTKGCLWRCGDRENPNLFIHDREGGPWDAQAETGKPYMPRLNADSQPGLWRPVECQTTEEVGIPGGLRKFARSVRHGEPHPMSGENALRGFEIIMGIYESARLNRKLHFPLTQEAFPLELMMKTENSHG